MAYGLPNMSFIGYPLPIPGPAHAGFGLREATRADSAEMLAHLRALGDDDRRMRFCTSVNDAHLARHVRETWSRSTFALAAFDGPLWSTPFLRGGPIRALAEFAVSGGEAEIGISVDRDIRRHGLATWMLQTAAQLLSQRGVLRITAFTMRENASFLTLARKASAELEWDAGEVAITFDTETLARTYLRRRISDQVFPRVA